VVKKWSVEMTDEAEATLRADFEYGRIISEDIKVIKRWIADVEEQGLEYAQRSKDWRDHELEGEWKGHNAISFSHMGRVIYRVENEKVIVRVVRVTADHDYKKK
jgi:addiction module RelE/StbE family toxin